MAKEMMAVERHEKVAILRHRLAQTEEAQRQRDAQKPQPSPYAKVYSMRSMTGYPAAPEVACLLTSDGHQVTFMCPWCHQQHWHPWPVGAIESIHDNAQCLTISEANVQASGYYLRLAKHPSDAGRVDLHDHPVD